MAKTQEDYCLVRDIGSIIKGGVVGAYNGLNALAPNLGKQVFLAATGATLLYLACHPKADTPSEDGTRYHFAPVRTENIESTVEKNGFPWLPVGAGVAGGAALTAGALALRNRRRRNSQLEDMPEIRDALRTTSE